MAPCAPRDRRADEEPLEAFKAPTDADSTTTTRLCLNCGAGRMIVIAELAPGATSVHVALGADVCMAGGN
jgi:hypothetical protein